MKTEVTNTIKNMDDSKLIAISKNVIEKAYSGFAGLSGAEELAKTYLQDTKYFSNDDRVDALIKWETAKNFTSGFVTGVGGALNLPVAVTSMVASLGGALVIQARLVATIAKIYGYDLKDDRVKTMILCTAVGMRMSDAIKAVGIKVSTKIANEKIPAIFTREVLNKINALVCKRFIAQSGTKSIIVLSKLVPVLGGFVGGTFDAVTCRITAKLAKKVFSKDSPDIKLFASEK